MITVLGEALIDLVESSASGPDHYAALPGGSPLNVAIGLARLEQPARLLARLSSDAFGRRLRAHAESNGVELDAVVSAEEPTTLAVASLDSKGQASYDFYLNGSADWQWSDAELDGAAAGSQALHFGSIASWLPPGREAIERFIRRVHAHGGTLISYDPNVRPSLLGHPRDARALVERGAASAHVVKASEEDIAWLYPDVPIDAVAHRWLDAGALLVTVTSGPNGASAFGPAGRADHAAPQVQVVDTVGAGDAFTSGLLDAIVRVGATTPGDLATLDRPTIVRLLDHATLVAALTCERAGADPPRRGELPRVPVE